MNTTRAASRFAEPPATNERARAEGEGVSYQVARAVEREMPTQGSGSYRVHVKALRAEIRPRSRVPDVRQSQRSVARQFAGLLQACEVHQISLQTKQTLCRRPDGSFASQVEGLRGPCPRVAGTVTVGVERQSSAELGVCGAELGRHSFQGSLQNRSEEHPQDALDLVMRRLDVAIDGIHGLLRIRIRAHLQLAQEIFAPGGNSAK